MTIQIFEDGWELCYEYIVGPFCLDPILPSLESGWIYKITTDDVGLSTHKLVRLWKIRPSEKVNKEVRE